MITIKNIVHLSSLKNETNLLLSQENKFITPPAIRDENHRGNEHPPAPPAHYTLIPWDTPNPCQIFKKIKFTNTIKYYTISVLP